jgi:hypothetical protein
MAKCKVRIMEKDTKPAEAVESRIKGKFKPGVSGNPLGRKKGTRNRSTMAAFEALRVNAGALAEVAINAAMNGDTAALKLCLDKLLPTARDMPVDILLPKIETVADLPRFTTALLDGVSSGKLGPSEAEKFCKIVMAHTQAIQVSEFEQRISVLEANIKKGNQK